MKKIKIHCYWGIEVDIEHEKQIELYVDDMRIMNNPTDSIKFLLMCEPNEIQGLDEMVIANQKKADYILTHSEDVLNACSNAHLFEFGTTWIKDYKFPKKEFSVSSIIGFKTQAEGHLLRHKLWYKQNKIKIPKKIFLSRTSQGIEKFVDAPILGDSKNPVFDSQFHITIENAKRNNWFTEKIIDCFQTKTVPIYWGCPNIEKYFNTDGIIIVDNFKDLLKKTNALTPDIYDKMKLAIEENYKLSMEFADIHKRTENKIKELLKIK